MKLDTKSLDKDILAPVFKAFNLAGFQLLYVGGCVRNAILKCGPTDIDLATDATPSQTVSYTHLTLPTNREV